MALTALGSVGLGCEVASSGCPKQGHHMFPSTPSSVRQATLSHKFLFFKKFANEYVKYSTISIDNFMLIKIFFRDMKRMRILGGKFKTTILRNSVKAFKIEEVQSVQGMLDQNQQSLKLKGP